MVHSCSLGYYGRDRSWENAIHYSSMVYGRCPGASEMPLRIHWFDNSCGELYVCVESMADSLAIETHLRHRFNVADGTCCT